MTARLSRLGALLAAGLAGLVLGGGLVLALGRHPAAQGAPGPGGYVIDVADGDQASWHTALNAARLIHGAYPAAHLEIVAHGAGIRLLLASSVDAADLASLASGDGVELAACANAMATYGITTPELVAGAVVVPAGVVEIARREALGDHYINAA